MIIIRAYGITIFTTVIGTSVGLTMTSMLGYGLSKRHSGPQNFELLCGIYHAV